MEIIKISDKLKHLKKAFINDINELQCNLKVLTPENEKWLKIENYDNYYISNYGFVKNINKNIILRPNIGKDGYYYVVLSKNNKKQTCKIHRLVALHFIENKENKKTVNHKDFNKLNNIYTNLEWNTYKENNLYSMYAGRYDNYWNSLKGKKINARFFKLKKNEIIQIKQDVNKLKIKTIAEKFNVSESTIYKIKSGERWKNLK